MTKSIKEKKRIKEIQILNDKNIEIDSSMLKLRIRYQAVDTFSSYGGPNFNKRMKNRYYKKNHVDPFFNYNYRIAHFINIKKECEDLINSKIRENLIGISNTLKIYDWKVSVIMSTSNNYLYKIQFLIENKKHKIDKIIHTYNNKKNLIFINNNDYSVDMEKSNESILGFHGSFERPDDIDAMKKLLIGWHDTTITLNRQHEAFKSQKINIRLQHENIIDMGNFHQLTKFKYISFIANKTGIYYQLNYDVYDYINNNIINGIFFNINSLDHKENLLKNLVFLNVFGDNVKLNELQSSNLKDLIEHIQLISY